MTVSLKANADGVSGAIQVNGTDFVTVGGTATTPNGVTISSSNSNYSQMIFNGYNAFGGAGYHGFLSVTNTYNSTTKTRHMRLDSAGAIEFINNAYSIVTHSFTDAGAFTATGDITAFSDERLKTNWKNLRTDFVYQLANVKSGVFDRLDIDATQVGVSAQSLQKILPQAVTTSNDFLTVNYGAAAMVSAVELAKMVVALKVELDLLKREVDELRK